MPLLEKVVAEATPFKIKETEGGRSPARGAAGPVGQSAEGLLTRVAAGKRRLNRFCLTVSRRFAKTILTNSFRVRAYRIIFVMQR